MKDKKQLKEYAESGNESNSYEEVSETASDKDDESLQETSGLEDEDSPDSEEASDYFE